MLGSLEVDIFSISYFSKNGGLQTPVIKFYVYKVYKCLIYFIYFRNGYINTPKTVVMKFSISQRNGVDLYQEFRKSPILS